MDKRRRKIQAHCHRQEEWTTPNGEKRFAMINANQHPETGEISWDASANGGRIEKLWHEERKTDGRNSTDLVHDARTRRTNRMAHQNENYYIEKPKADTPKVEEEDATKDTKLQDLIAEDDYQRDEIPDMTVGELRDRMKKGEAYYDLVPVDSVIREVHFSAISTAHNIDYDEVYHTRLHNDK